MMKRYGEQGVNEENGGRNLAASTIRVRRDGYDVDEEDGGQDPGGEYDSE